MSAAFDEIVPTKRREERTKTHRRAECRVGDKLWAGVVHDASESGVFFQPLQCLSDGERIEVEDAWMAGSPDETVKLHLPNAVVDPTPRTGRVRWSGCSDVHHCAGLGLSLDAQAA